MKKLAIPVIFLFGFSILALTLDDVKYPQESTTNSELLDYHVPSEYPTIQSAVDAAADAGGNDIVIFVDEGEYREAVIATGLRNLKLIGRKARILPPPEFVCTDPPVDDHFPSSSLTLINCENFRVEGFAFIGDNFEESTRQSYPMGNSIRSINSSGIISNNIIFNYFDGIFFQANDPRWMKGEISDNYIHNCLWSGIFATGSHDLRIQKNKIAFTVPKALSISVGIWTDGGIGIISENHIVSYRAVDYHPQQKTISGSDLWSARFQYTKPREYRVIDNTFEQSAAATRFSNTQMATDQPNRSLQRTSTVYSHFINVVQANFISEHADMVMLPPD